MPHFPNGHSVDDPLFQEPGWWRRPDRILFPKVEGRTFENVPTPCTPEMRDVAPRHLVILGASGTLGSSFARICDVRGLPYHLLSRRELDIYDENAVARVLRSFNGWGVINATGYVRIDQAESDRANCWKPNVLGCCNLAKVCSDLGVQLVCFSSDMVFDGTSDVYDEGSRVNPVNFYGESKAEMERLVSQLHPCSLIVRTSSFFGPWDPYNFVSTTLEAVRAGRRVSVASNVRISPTFVVELANVTLDLLIDAESGIWHLANRGSVSWEEFARLACEVASVDSSTIEGQPIEALGLVARRPPSSVLISTKAWMFSDLMSALRTCFEMRERQDTSCQSRDGPPPFTLDASM